jgi:hypothetical protein
MENISSSFILATALVERMLDVVALILVAIFSLLSIKNLPASFYLVVRGMEVIVVVGTIFIWIAPALEVQLINLMGRVIKNEAWYTKISGLIRHFLEGMRLLKDKRRAGSGLSSALPSTPGYVGVYQFVAVMILVPFGFTQSEALATIILSQIANYLIVTFWGCVSIWKIYH